jgi:hypothetical protein
LVLLLPLSCSAAIIPAQQIMRPFMYKTHHQLFTFASGKAMLVDMQRSIGKQRFSQYKLLSKGLPEVLWPSGLSSALMNCMAALPIHDDLNKQLRRLKALQVNRVRFISTLVLLSVVYCQHVRTGQGPAVMYTIYTVPCVSNIGDSVALDCQCAAQLE